MLLGMTNTRWYKALGARSSTATNLVHATDREGGPACGRTLNTYLWKPVDADATCPNCLARIAAATALGPAGIAQSRIQTA
jgi:hypothetical protein